MLPADRLDTIDVNDRFLTVLQHRLDHEWAYRYRPGQVQLIHGPVQELQGEASYDFIISCLPLNNFPVSLVRDIFRSFVRLLKPGGTLTYFEYVLIRQLTTPFVNRHERGRLARIGRVVDHYIRSYEFRRQRVLINVPPAIVRHLQLKPANGTVRHSRELLEASKIPSPVSL
jgi:phosphatidylethanolamine/phosphatidyl-N-methylethanolamine N-methyltransferase